MQRVEDADHLGRGRAGQGLALLVDAHLGDDRQIRRHRTGGQACLAQLHRAGERLEDQQVHAGFEQRLDLLDEDGACLFGRDRSDRR